MSKIQELEHIGGLPLDVDTEPIKNVGTLETLHVLFYIHGNSRHIQNVNFSFNGTFKEAIARGRQFCERMGWKFIKVEPFLTNLEEREKRNMGE